MAMLRGAADRKPPPVHIVSHQLGHADATLAYRPCVRYIAKVEEVEHAVGRVRRRNMSKDRAQRDLLRRILARRDREALKAFGDLDRGFMSEADKEFVREIVADELVEHGLQPDDEPTPYGLALEELIDWLGHA